MDLSRLELVAFPFPLPLSVLSLDVLSLDVLSRRLVESSEADSSCYPNVDFFAVFFPKESPSSAFEACSLLSASRRVDELFAAAVFVALFLLNSSSSSVVSPDDLLFLDVRVGASRRRSSDRRSSCRASLRRSRRSSSLESALRPAFASLLRQSVDDTSIRRRSSGSSDVRRRRRAASSDDAVLSSLSALGGVDLPRARRCSTGGSGGVS